MDYQLKPISRTCAATGEGLEPGSMCRSVLVEREGKVVRLDYSETAWTGPPDGTIGHWRCHVPSPEIGRTKPLDIDGMVTWFEQLSETPGNPVQERIRYVLALLLIRKRRFILDGSREDGETSYLRLAGAHGEGQFEVREFDLEPEQIEELQQQLSHQMAGEGSGFQG